jgi:hypothetical protein
MISVCLCYKYGDWKNWKKYHATILFFILGILVCDLLTYNKPLETLDIVIDGIHITPPY